MKTPTRKDVFLVTAVAVLILVWVVIYRQMLDGDAGQGDAETLPYVGPPIAADQARPRRQGPVSPANDGDIRTLPLDLTLSRVIPGGGDRYLVLFSHKERRVRVFDIAAETILWGRDDVPARGLVAASSQVVAIGDAAACTFRCFDLRSGEPRGTHALRNLSSIGDLHAGANTIDRYVLQTGGEKGIAFYDAVTRELDQLVLADFGLKGVDKVVHVSPSGRHALLMDQYQYSLLRLDTEPKTKISLPRMPTQDRPVTVWSDAQAVSTGRSIYRFTEMGGGRLHFASLTDARSQSFVPSLDGSLFLQSGRWPPQPGQAWFVGTTAGDIDRLARLPALKLIEESARRTTQSQWVSLPMHQRINYSASLGRIVLVPYEGDRLHLVDVDYRENRIEREIALVANPPANVLRGRKVSCALSVVPESAATLTLEYGPDGSAVSVDGLFEWLVPDDFPFDRASVVVSARTPQGEQAFRSFVMTIGR